MVRSDLLSITLRAFDGFRSAELGSSFEVLGCMLLMRVRRSSGQAGVQWRPIGRDGRETGC